MFRKMVLGVFLVLAPGWAGAIAADDLASAIKSRNMNQVLALLKAGADPNRHSRYETPIGLAARG